MRFGTYVFFAMVDVSLVSALRTTPHGGIAIPLMKRANLTDQNGVVNVDVLRRQAAKVSGKLRRGFKAFHKNMGSYHPNDISRLSLAKRDTGAVNLTDDDSVLWHGTILVGTPPVSFTVDFDTGSSDLFLPGSSCDESCEGHTVYNTEESSTAQDLGRNFSLSYADGSTVQGDQFTDAVTIAGLNASEQTLGSATRYSTGFGIQQFPPDGLMGMAFQEISAFNAQPLFHTLVAQNQTVPQFSFKLAKTGSELFLGGANQELFSGSITQTNVTQKGFWQVRLEGFTVDQKVTSANVDAIIDTGTTIVCGTSEEVAQLYSEIPGSKEAPEIGQGFYTFPCNTSPSIALQFGGKSFAISADTFNLGIAELGSTQCVGGVTAVNGDVWVIGDVFLQNVYTVFDVGNSSVGFADLV